MRKYEYETIRYDTSTDNDVLEYVQRTNEVGDIPEYGNTSTIRYKYGNMSTIRYEYGNMSMSMKTENPKPEWISTLTHAYSCTMSQSTGFSPFFLMFGRIPRIPINVEFGVTLPNLSDTSRQNYAQKLKAHLRWTYRKAYEVNLKELARHKKYYDRKFKCMKLEPGDTVLV